MRTWILLLAAFLVAGCSEVSENRTALRDEVKITASGFDPATITINSGESVTWTNSDTKPHWVASAAHPTHDEYPERGGCIGSKFDSCGSIGPGESFTFGFSRKGSWKYHDHLNPGLTGTVVVS
ncbi:cupredoxin domain-containing protein [Candidatus Woesearchaeota archaeon]|nr:cupredoxin domain-containing protein [Candidatus Woesearchaeota archaeon]